MVTRPKWLSPVSLVLSLIGLAISTYLTYEHFTDSTTLACSATGKVDCLLVTTSQWSRFLGMPVAVLGLVYFIVMTLLCLPQVWRGPRIIDHVRLVMALGGLAMVFWLIWAELFKIHAICLWCTGVHITTFVLVVVLAIGAIFTYEER